MVIMRSSPQHCHLESGSRRIERSKTSKISPLATTVVSVEMTDQDILYFNPNNLPPAREPVVFILPLRGGS